MVHGLTLVSEIKTKILSRYLSDRPLKTRKVLIKVEKKNFFISFLHAHDVMLDSLKLVRAIQALRCGEKTILLLADIEIVCEVIQYILSRSVYANGLLLKCSKIRCCDSDVLLANH